MNGYARRNYNNTALHANRTALVNYQQAVTKLNGRQTRKLANNTYLERIDENTIGVKLHQTYVVTYKEDGAVILNSGGWRTNTTKDRINMFSPKGISQMKGVWYMDGGKLYYDGVIINPDGSTTAKEETKERKQGVTLLKKKIKEYAVSFVDALHGGMVPAPSAGDCWYCLMKTDKGETLGQASKNTDHLRLHMEQSYFVPSILTQAMQTFGASIACKQTAYAYMEKKLEYAFLTDRKAFIFEQMENYVYKWIKRQYGLC